MKVFFSYKFTNNSWGGGNQFLKSLSIGLKKKISVVLDENKADIIIFNSHQNFLNVLKQKLKFPDKIFVHRIDGPMSSYRGYIGLLLDKLIYLCNYFLADGTVFMSNWSKKRNFKNGFIKNNKIAVIHNSTNEKFFYRKKFKLNNRNKIKLLSSSWSKNYLKGFDILQFLDQKLDFKKFKFIFIGNSPIKFKNIKSLKPRKNTFIRNYLYKSDIFIFTSKVESCSNSLLEAMSTGIKVVCINKTSNKEIFNNNGYFFNGKNDVINAINKTVKNFNTLKEKKNHSLDKTCQNYVNFFKNLSKTNTKKINFFIYINLFIRFYLLKILEYIYILILKK